MTKTNAPTRINDDLHEHTRKLQQYTGSVASRITPTNQNLVRRTLQARFNHGLKASSNYSYANALLSFDQAIHGKSLTELTPQDCADAITTLRNRIGARSLFTLLRHVRSTIKEALNLDRLPTELDRALQIRRPPMMPTARLLTDDQFDRLLQATTQQAQQGTLPWAEHSQAILWTLWDTGFRARELLSLNVGDITFEDQRGAQIALRPGTPDLKTGPRTIYVTECTGPLRAWLGLHPNGADPQAPLFTAFQDRTGKIRLNYKTLLLHIKLLGTKSGVNHDSSRGKTLSPHDFRHTCATRKAKAGWMEAETRAYFGWAPGSHMPSLYVHLGLGDMRDRVRRDAGINDTGHRITSSIDNDAEALAALIQRLAQQGAKTKQPRTAGMALP